MGDFRARDADRDRYVEVIDAAFVDGQLGAADRELRVSRALAAETLAELEALTRDLQNRPAPVRPGPPAPARPPLPSNRAAGRLIAITALVMAGIGLVSVLAAGQSAEESSGTSLPSPYEVVETVSSPTFVMREAEVREFVTAYESRFGSLEPYEVTFLPRRVTVQVPVAGYRPRYEMWTWDGMWTKDAEPKVLTPAHGPVDLRELDVARLFANIRTAKDALRVEDARLALVVLSRASGDPAVVTIRVTNDFNEPGSMTTTQDGRILGRQPFTRSTP